MTTATATPAPRLRGLLLAIFVSSMPATLILPMMPSLGQQLHVSSTSLGMLFGIYPLTSVIAAPVWGRISDRFGRKPALLGSLAGAGIAFLTFGLASTYAGLFVARALQGLSGSARGIGFAVMSDTTEGEERAAGMGSVTAAMALAFTLGPVLGAAFMSDDPAGWVRWVRHALGAPDSGFDHLLPSLFGALLNAVAFVIVLGGFRETWKPGASHGTGTREAGPSAHASLLGAVVVMLMLQFLLSGLIQGTLQFSFTLWADHVLAWSAREIALSLAALGLGFVLASGVFLRPLLRRLPASRVVLLGVIIDLTGMTIFLLHAELWHWAVAGLFISSLGGGFWGTTIVGLLSREAPKAHQGLIMGIANGAGLIGRVGGPPLAGLAAEALGPRAPFAAIVGCLVLILLTALRGPAKRPAA